MRWIIALLLMSAAPAFGQGVDAAALNAQLRADVESLDAFANSQRRSYSTEKLYWTMYGKAGLFGFQNRIGDGQPGRPTFFRRPGPRIGGKVHVGIHVSF